MRADIEDSSSDDRAGGKSVKRDYNEVSVFQLRRRIDIMLMY